MFSVIFTISNLIALSGWVLLIFFGRKKITDSLVHSGVLSFAISLIYWLSFFMVFKEGMPAGSDVYTVEGVRQFFSSEWGVVAGWTHYLAFDLLIGSQIYNRFKNAKSIILYFFLMTTMVFAPIGWSLSWFYEKFSKKV